jgi:hypothetical protein
MTVTDTGSATGWSLAERLPEHVSATCLYDSAGWLAGWERIGVEQRTRHAYVCAAGQVLPLYETTMSPFWHGYELQCDLVGRFGNPIVFAGSSYSMYGKRGPVAPDLAVGAHTAAMEWIDGGAAELLVVPNVTEEGVRSWVEAVGQPIATIHLERTYAIDVRGTFGDHLYRIDNKIRRDVERRLRRAGERGLVVRMVEGAAAHALVPQAFPLTVDTSDKNDWPALFDEAALHDMLDVPGAMLVAASVGDRLIGAFFAFRRGDEVTYMCGGVDYPSLNEYSTYIGLMYRSTQWAYDNGMRRIEWGRDNYRFKERHGLTGTDLYALFYAPTPRPDLVAPLAKMDDILHTYIEAA